MASRLPDSDELESPAFRALASIGQFSVAATPLQMALVAAGIFVGPMFGPSLGLPTWLLDLSPFTHVPNAPAVAIGVEPLLGLLAVCALLAAAGVVTMRHRNLALPA